MKVRECISEGGKLVFLVNLERGRELRIALGGGEHITVANCDGHAQIVNYWVPLFDYNGREVRLDVLR